MLRRFTRTVGRYPQGTIRDWPMQTWRGFNRNVDVFSEPVMVQPVPLPRFLDRNKGKEAAHGTGTV